jgi:hypothetical protein
MQQQAAQSVNPFLQLQTQQQAAAQQQAAQLQFLQQQQAAAAMSNGFDVNQWDQVC